MKKEEKLEMEEILIFCNHSCVESKLYRLIGKIFIVFFFLPVVLKKKGIRMEIGWKEVAGKSHHRNV